MKATILVGDVRQRLKDIPDNTVQACITSPPYWGLRDYGTASWDGGDPNCDHLGKPMATKANINRNCGTGNDVKNATAREFFKDVCGKCGAERRDQQIGLEQSPAEYVAEMVAVFEEVRRVLKDDGVLWLNLGDSYVGTGSKGDCKDPKYAEGRNGQTVAINNKVQGLKSKDLVGIPWRVAFALQETGWWLRQDIIWHKPNPMPESVTDRCTKAHEYLFMLTKSSRYYFDHEAIKEEAKYQPGGSHDDVPQGGFNDKGPIPGSGQRSFRAIRETRNKRSVWTIPTKPFKGAHFAVMPEALCEPPILASSRENDLILDPFTGSGTVAVVALRHGRNFIGTELNPEYAQIAINRITNDQPLLNEVEVK
jgi:DNA modification methylase